MAFQRRGIHREVFNELFRRGDVGMCHCRTCNSDFPWDQSYAQLSDHVAGEMDDVGHNCTAPDQAFVGYSRRALHALYYANAFINRQDLQQRTRRDIDREAQRLEVRGIEIDLFQDNPDGVRNGEAVANAEDPGGNGAQEINNNGEENGFAPANAEDLDGNGVEDINNNGEENGGAELACAQGRNEAPDPIAVIAGAMNPLIPALGENAAAGRQENQVQQVSVATQAGGGDPDPGPPTSWTDIFFMVLTGIGMAVSVFLWKYYFQSMKSTAVLLEGLYYVLGIGNEIRKLIRCSWSWTCYGILFIMAMLFLLLWWYTTFDYLSNLTLLFQCCYYVIMSFNTARNLLVKMC